MDGRNTQKLSWLLLTGPPGIGKTTVCKKVSEKLKQRNCCYTGFYTEEVRGERHDRIGFDVISIQEPSKKLPLARAENILKPQQFSQFRVGKYHVFIDKFEEIALPILQSTDNILLIDEIGKMELFSNKFFDEINKLMDSKSKGFIVATIPLLNKVPQKYLPFFKKLCNNESSKVINVNQQNRNDLSQEIVNMIL
ncbi:cancer-related nucleoside-triphosphatase [Prorops nasuta]|uniref:cancer-related nucleoside-triphosphatase n=1 Tax=Prorops nasuta TaxID=863751 RepID=UPI0034CD88E5